MSSNNNPVYPQIPVSQVSKFVNADGSTPKALYTPSGPGGRVDSIMVTNTDTAPYTVQLFLQRAAANYLLGSAVIPTSAGNLGTVQPVNLLAAIGAASAGQASFITDPFGNVVIPVDAASSLFWAPTTTVASGKTLSAVTFGGDYLP